MARCSAGAAAAVTGGAHRAAGRPGQDAALVDVAAGIAVVADGCGSAPASEVGARLVVRLWRAAVRRQQACAADLTAPATWIAARADVVAALRALVAATDPELAASHLQCTSLVGVVTADHVVVYAVGDGGCGGAIAATFLPGADNAPSYIAADLVGAGVPGELRVVPRAAAGWLWVGSDGITELAAAAPGALEALLAEPRVTTSDERLRRRLEALARPIESIDWAAQRVVHVPAALRDDGALAVLRWDGAA